MKILHCSDIHLDECRYGGRDAATGMPSAYLSNLEVLRFIAASAIERRVDALVIAGDLFTRGRPASEMLVAAIESLSQVVRARVPVVIVEGNHERISLAQRHRSATHVLAAALEPLGESRVATSKPLGIRLSNGLQIAALPWLDKPSVLAAMGRTQAGIEHGDALVADYYRRSFETMMGRVDTGGPLIASSHVTVDASGLRGSQNDLHTHLFSEPIIDPVLFDDSPISYAALGHIHTRARIGRTCYYAGSPNRLTFADADEPKSVNLVTLDGRTATVEHLATPARDLQRLHLADITDARPGALVELTLEAGMNEIPERARTRLARSGAQVVKVVHTPMPPAVHDVPVIPENASSADALRAWLEAHRPDADIPAIIARAQELTS